MNVVYVLSPDRAPLMPCKPVIARLLLKQGKAKVRQGRFSPTMRSKIDAHLREIRFVQSILPITSIVLETGTFDPHETIRKLY